MSALALPLLDSMVPAANSIAPDGDLFPQPGRMM
jgi:hypothetical protein